jgi:outer membrane protein OmpA-like peptidoglycan-associated protein
MKAFPVILLGVAISGCATKGFVNRNVADVNEKVEGVSQEVEKTQDRVKNNEARIGEVDKTAQSALTRAGDAEQAANAAKGKLVYTVTLSNDKVTFPKDKASISDDAKTMIDDAVGPLLANNRPVFFEISGHTDSTGPEQYNRVLAEERAEAVRDYLHDQHKIALSRMAVISYGESRPVVDNKTKQSRAQNRRVVIDVLE